MNILMIILGILWSLLLNPDRNINYLERVFAITLHWDKCKKMELNVKKVQNIGPLKT